MKAAWLIGCSVWGLSVVTGMNMLWRYRSTPAAAASVLERWPEASPLRRDPARPTLVMFMHPRCPCSRASVGELDKLAQRFGDRAALHVLFVKPAGTAEGWERTDSWAGAMRIPGVAVAVDRDGAEAARFGAHTSGQVLLYDAGGRLLFQGGITGGRGHAGDNLGEARVAALLSGGAVDRSTSPVFGCALGEREEGRR